MTVLEERLGRLKGEKVVLSEELAFLQQGMHSLEGERNELVEKVTRMEAELRDTQATLNASRVDCHCERDHLIVELQFPFHLFTCVLHVHNLLVHNLNVDVHNCSHLHIHVHPAMHVLTTFGPTHFTHMHLHTHMHIHIRTYTHA